MPASVQTKAHSAPTAVAGGLLHMPVSFDEGDCADAVAVLKQKVRTSHLA